MQAHTHTHTHTHTKKKQKPQAHVNTHACTHASIIMSHKITIIIGLLNPLASPKGMKTRLHNVHNVNILLLFIIK